LLEFDHITPFGNAGGAHAANIRFAVQGAQSASCADLLRSNAYCGENRGSEASRAGRLSRGKVRFAFGVRGWNIAWRELRCGVAIAQLSFFERGGPRGLHGPKHLAARKTGEKNFALIPQHGANYPV
jgi:hypothetical protein